MKKSVIKILIMCGCIIFSQAIKNDMVFAAANDTANSSAITTVSSKAVNNIDNENLQKSTKDSKYVNADIAGLNSISKVDVPVDKVWKIRFNMPLDSSLVKDKIKIINKDTGVETTSSVSLSENDTVVTISSHCDPNSNYSLIIDKDLKSKNNKSLNNPVYVEFKTAGQTASAPVKTDTLISYIDDVNVTIKENDKFSFPTTINATMSDGTTKKVNVSWDKHVDVSSKPGTYTYYGVIDGYSKKVRLNLTITGLDSPSSATDELKIDSTKDINLTAKQYDNFTAPDTIDGVTSDGKVVKVKVKWDNPITTNREPGKYTYYGTAEGCLVKAVLNLTITAPEIKTHSDFQKNLYNYLSNADNRQSVMTRAIELHGGDLSNNCAYFASEALRRAGLSDLPESVANTRTLTNELLSRGWVKSTNLDELRSGDICFTIAYDSSGPTHTYTFMRWVDPNSHEYAYICDNQGNEYEGDPYHKRNINFATETKDPISYFMYVPQQ
ncbi:hypothetical protein Ccar_14565 [Clostridium carboxidivorans P7]|uniref:Ig domain protein n=1 Tax=Clostridium carboxidivorans P7 TaxID=536227 RepID=C6PYP3_9CLOT|nr:Ig-like domain-containing protein [Clostridium carboxidivorans]AKN32019.1 hypothetical protein Ccar_14565 [Clostridium carboxidivorans P7]EET85624.1 Ig domain protein [Clostridium carboxidivorans P7]EFG87841.1 bacterial Ig-like domain (group 4) [Clostridium carboxidivorans P7]